MIKKLGRPITGARPSISHKKPYVPSADSLDAQRQIKEPPAPFKNNMTAAQMPAGTNPKFRADSRFEKDTLSRVKVSNYPLRDPIQVNHAAVGYPQGPYVSRNGINSINSGYALSGNKRTAGFIGTNEGPRASAAEVRRIKATYPGIGVGKWRP
jgi:hypothetical protein